MDLQDGWRAMNDVVSIARRLRDYAEEPATPSQKRADLLDAAAALLVLHQMLGANIEPPWRQ